MVNWQWSMVNETRSALAAIIALRTTINAVMRSPMPFLGAIALAYNASPSSVGWLGVAFSLAGFVSPFAGALEARLGRASATVLSMGLFVAVCLAVPFAPTLAAAGAMFVLLGVAKALFEPQTLAFLSEIVPFERRGAAIGLVELAWALSWIIGTPLMGWFVDLGRWWLLFVVMGLATAVFTVIFLRMLRAHPQPARAAGIHMTFDSMRAVFAQPSARTMLFYSLLLTLPAQLTTLLYGPWLQQQFTLTPTLLGVVSIVIGVADLLAELAAALFIDRLGKWRALIGSTGLYIAALLFFWLGGGNLVTALFGLFLVFFAFEFALVTSLTVNSELVPAARATMAGFVAGVHGIGRVAASLIALPLFLAGQLTAPTLVGVLCVALALWASFHLRQRVMARL
jgi:MFS transporter, DHA1 family, inner membrane transport protein